MFDHLHGIIAKQIGATNAGDAGLKFDAIATHTQAAFWAPK